MLKRTIKRGNSDYPLGSKRMSQRKCNPVKSKAILGDRKAKDEDEKLLEKIVLGGEDDLFRRLEEPQHDLQITQKKASDDHLEEPNAAWEDDDDEDVRVKISEKDFRHKYFKHRDKTEISGEAYAQTLKSQFSKVTGQPSWAKLHWQKSDDEAEESDDEPEAKQMLQSTGNYLSTSESLAKGILEIKQCTDANKEQPLQSKLRAMEFHPSAQVMLTGGTSQTLALFQIDGKYNPKIQSIFLEGFPIMAAHFTRDGTEVVMSSKHRSFKYYDMIAGRVVNVPKIKGLEDDKIEQFQTSPDGKYLVFIGQYGRMHLISTKSKEWISTMKMNGTVDAVAFSESGTKMFSHGDDGEVYIWDMNTRECVHKFTDEGCIKGTSLAVSRSGQYIAAGSHSGVVNIYDERCLTERRPTPLKAIMNLTTPCTDMVFNATSEILALASHDAERALKMVHVPSLTVFSNFPDRTDSIRIPYKVDFSLNSGYFSIGNNKGQALLYRLKHYSNY